MMRTLITGNGFALVPAMKPHAEKRYSSTHSSPWDEPEVSGQLWPRSKSPRYPQTEGFVEFKGILDVLDKINISC